MLRAELLTDDSPASYGPIATTANSWSFAADQYSGGTLSVKLLWSSNNANAGDVYWSVQLGALEPVNATGEPAFGAEALVPFTHGGGKPDRLNEAVLALSRPAALGPGAMCVLRLRRRAANALDTMPGDAVVRSIVVTES